jgi:hypothetical protein
MPDKKQMREGKAEVKCRRRPRSVISAVEIQEVWIERVDSIPAKMSLDALPKVE